MPGRVIGHTSFVHIPELNSILKIKKGFLIATLSDSFCKENKINPEELEFDIIKDSDKIKLVAHGTERTELENHTPVKMEASNIGK